jgi:2-polyprenyl-6-methoxyphenol hydroxylase-like FAD-dependent oxidoreductase
MMPNSNPLCIAIVGAGPAGLAAAVALARGGHRVTVFEKHAALAPLGAGVLIQPQGVAALESLGVGAAFHAASVPVTRLLGTCHRNWTLVDIPYARTEARGISRTALAQVLLDAALLQGVSIAYGSTCASAVRLIPRASVRAYGISTSVQLR